MLKILPLGAAEPDTNDTASDTPDEAQHRKRRPGTKSGGILSSNEHCHT